MVATGAAKSSGIAAMIKGPHLADCPAILMRPHIDMKLLLDQAEAKDFS